MERVSKVWEFIRDMFGFRRNSKYVRTYLNEANIKSSIYMSFIVIILEIWMIIRNINKYVSPLWNNYGTSFTSNFDVLYTYIGLYLLFIMSSIAVLFFAITYYKKINSKGARITNLTLAGICILWPFLLFCEHLGFNGSKAVVNSVTTLVVYLAMPLLGGGIIAHTLFLKKADDYNSNIAMIAVVIYALICLAFGFKVGYSDFANPYYKGGVPNFDRIKMITCYLTMVIFVACLLIWKPYFSIVMLTGIFIAFMALLKGYGERTFLEADEINYITFLISLTMITISIYQQRITEAKKDEKLIHDAVYDHMADIHNLKYLVDKVTTESMFIPNYLDDKIVLFINIANFRIYNDQKGFEAGDLFLIKMARFVKDTFGGEYSARQSDDHFVVFTSMNGLESRIERLKNLVDNASAGLFIRLKVGGCKPTADEHPSRIIDKARYACGMIKRKQEVYYSEYTDEMDDRFKKRQYIVNHIDEAIEKGWIRAYYQPVVWSKNKELCGAEALARWIDPVYGFLSPADFIPVLEEARLIHKLDEGIVKYVCSNMRRAIDENRPVVPVSINFSRLDFELMDVIKVIEENVEKYNIDKNYIHVEVTESALADNVDELHRIIGEIKNLGYAVWLDDFGSGYSSLNVLKDFTFDVVKIDMTFLSNFDTNEKTKDILDCIIQLANRLGMKTLTEGVETEAESTFLENIGCGRLQGYLFGKPFVLRDFEDKIEVKEFTISKDII